MTDHFIVYLLCLPLIVGLGIVNTRHKVFTTGEIRFWGVCIFIGAELVYLGVF